MARSGTFSMIFLERGSAAICSAVTCGTGCATFPAYLIDFLFLNHNCQKHAGIETKGAMLHMTNATMRIPSLPMQTVSVDKLAQKP